MKWPMVQDRLVMLKLFHLFVSRWSFPLYIYCSPLQEFLRDYEDFPVTKCIIAGLYKSDIRISCAAL